MRSKCCNARMGFLVETLGKDYAFCTKCGIVYHKIKKRIAEEMDEWD